MVKDTDGSVAGCHTTKAKAQKQMAALYAGEKQMVMTPEQIIRPPRENLVRAYVEPFELREEGSEMPTMRGRFAVFDQWTRIDSVFEGTFLERIAPGAFTQTIRENRKSMKVLFNHGHDPSIGDKVLGPIADLREDDLGAAYEVPLLDTSYNRDLLPGLKEGLYGSSFRFTVISDELVREPEPSDHNPDGIPERTITKARVFEFGPVTFPAYEGATSGARSLTAEFAFHRLAQDREGLKNLVTFENALTLKNTPTTPAYEPETSSNAGDGKTEEPDEKEEPAVEVNTDLDRFDSVEMLAARRNEIDERHKYLNAEAGGKPLAPEVKEEWDGLKAERALVVARITELEERQAYIDGLGQKVENTTAAVPPIERKTFQTRTRKGPDDPYALHEYRTAASSPGEETRLLIDGARRSIETSPMSMAGLDVDEARARAERTLNKLERGDDDNDAAGGSFAAYLLAVGSPTYRRAFGKFAKSAPVQAVYASEEANSIQQAKAYAERAFTLGSTGLPVPYQLDPTIIPVSNGSVNPFRVVSRIVQTTVNEWRGATSAGITAAYAAEGTEASDNTPTLTQPAIPAVRAQAFVPFSIEVGQDWPAIEAEMTSEVIDAKDDLEATKFTLGTGTNEPSGIIPGATTVAATTTAAFVIADTYKLEEAVPARFRPRASVIGNRAILNKIRQFDTAGGSGVWLDVPGLSQLLPSGNGVQMPRGMLGYPTFEDTAMDSALTTGSEILVMGDFRYYVIVDRVGMSADLIPHLVGTNHLPTGQRGLYFFWRNGAERVHAAAFRVLQT